MAKQKFSWVNFTLSFCNVIAAYCIIPDDLAKDYKQFIDKLQNYCK